MSRFKESVERFRVAVHREGERCRSGVSGSC